jgi:hypothetical protein
VKSGVQSTEVITGMAVTFVGLAVSVLMALGVVTPTEGDALTKALSSCVTAAVALIVSGGVAWALIHNRTKLKQEALDIGLDPDAVPVTLPPKPARMEGEKKGGVNPPNVSSERPPAPGGSGGVTFKGPPVIPMAVLALLLSWPGPGPCESPRPGVSYCRDAQGQVWEYHPACGGWRRLVERRLDRLERVPPVPQGPVTDPALLQALRDLSANQQMLMGQLRAAPLVAPVVPAPVAPVVPPAQQQHINIQQPPVPQLPQQPQTPAPVPGGPLQTLPIQGAPLQTLPIQGAPLQQLPIQGAPLQQLPIQGAPIQQLPIQGQPLQVLPQGGQPIQQLSPQGQPLQVIPQAQPPLQQLPGQGTPLQVPPTPGPPVQSMPPAAGAFPSGPVIPGTPPAQLLPARPPAQDLGQPPAEPLTPRGYSRYATCPPCQKSPTNPRSR